VGGWSKPRRPLSSPGRAAVPIVQQVGWTTGTGWRSAEKLPPPECDSRTVQPVSCRNTDYAIPPTDLSTATVRKFMILLLIYEFRYIFNASFYDFLSLPMRTAVKLQYICGIS
jgi:hypothetical protein